MLQRGFKTRPNCRSSVPARIVSVQASKLNSNGKGPAVAGVLASMLLTGAAASNAADYSQILNMAGSSPLAFKELAQSAFSAATLPTETVLPVAAAGLGTFGVIAALFRNKENNEDGENDSSSFYNNSNNNQNTNQNNNSNIGTYNTVNQQNKQQSSQAQQPVSPTSNPYNASFARSAYAKPKVNNNINPNNNYNAINDPPRVVERVVAPQPKNEKEAEELAARARALEVEATTLREKMGKVERPSSSNQNTNNNQNNGGMMRNFFNRASTPAASPTPAAPAKLVAKKERFVLAYSTGWDNAYIHYKNEKGQWTNLPGIKLDQVDEKMPGWKIVAIDGLLPREFVLHNNQNDWDNSMQTESRNYEVKNHGAYKLKKGTLQSIPESEAPAILFEQ